MRERNYRSLLFNLILKIRDMSPIIKSKEVNNVPTISMFYGILILMHLTRKEHSPPHIHAYYGQYDAAFQISDGEILHGTFPNQGKKLVKSFILKYHNELMNMWETEQYIKLPPIE